jgi:CBS domain containing-hemolysin-like protein
MSGLEPASAALAAALAALWAALLALAEEAPGVVSALGDPPTPVGSPLPLARALRIARVTLLLIAATAAGAAVAWSRRAPLDAAGTLLVGAVGTLLVGEGIPRALGAVIPRMAARALPLARASLTPFRPLFGIMAVADRLAHRLLPSSRARSGVLGPAQREMLVGVFSLEDMTAEDIMTPRLDIVGADAEASWLEVVDVVRRSEHSRIPVYRHSLDDIAGILYAKDIAPVLAGHSPPPASWHELVRPVPFVPEAKTLAAQLRDFQRGPAHLAIVVDEFGGTSGLVTLEDVLEEIVGEIRDEYDTDEEPAIEREGNDRFWVDGRVTLDDLSAAVGIPLQHDEVSTVGGLIYSELGRVPKAGEELKAHGLRIVVEQVVRRRIRRVYLERLEREPLVEFGLGHGDAEEDAP